MQTINLQTADGVVVKAPGVGIMLIYATSVTTVPADATVGYAPGCVCVDTVNGKMFLNEGSATSCDFNEVSVLTAAQEALIATNAALLDATPGTASANNAIICDGSNGVSGLTTLVVSTLTGVNIDAGISGVAGSVDVFPSTASKGKFTLSCDDQTGDTAVTLKPGEMAQATVLGIADPGAAGAYVPTAVDTVPGTGISTGTNTICEHSVTRVGSMYKTEILLDLTGLNDGGTAGDIIGKDGGTANCHIGAIAAAVNGTIVAGRITCFETPAGGNTDVDLWGTVTEATGAQDAAISTLTGETQLVNHGAWAAEEVDYLSALPGVGYLYLACGASTDADYTAGIFLIELWGV